MDFISFANVLKRAGKLTGDETDFCRKFRALRPGLKIENRDQFLVFLNDAQLPGVVAKTAVALFDKYEVEHPDRDCLNPDDIKKIQKALRQVWSWSYARRLVLKRCDLGGGYSRCEKCRKRVPKVHVDHIVAVGTFDGGYIERLFVPSTAMQGLCAVCHKTKTKADLATIKAKRSKVIEDFF